MELVISRGTFNPENHELEQSFEYSFNLLGTFIYCWINEVKYVGKRQIVKIEQLATKQDNNNLKHIVVAYILGREVSRPRDSMWSVKLSVTARGNLPYTNSC
jgi:hypothetical protein